MLLIETSINELSEYINLWNKEYILAMKHCGQREKYVAWIVSNVLITGIEVAPGRVLFESDNFNLQGTDKTAQRATKKLIELLHASFTIDNTTVASRAFSIMTRQAERTLRIIPASLANVKLNRKTKTEFKARAKEDNPEITDEEINKMWVNYRQLVEQQKVKQHEQERRRNMTADDAVEEWWRRVSIDESEHGNISPDWLKKQAPKKVRLQIPQVVKLIQEWIPKQRFRSEEAFEAALAEYLVGQGVSAPEQQGISLVDILAAQGIGIEVKLTPDRSEYDRLSGQIIRHLEGFGIAIVLIIRPDKRDLLDEYQARFSGDDRVTFITKS